MGTYDEARARTRTLIEESFWELYTQESHPKITVRSLVTHAGIHRSTFYMYYNNVDAVLDSIKERQLQLLKEICSMPRKSDTEHTAFLNAFQELFHKNRRYLEPLVCEYKDSEFSLQYRQIMKEELCNDFGMPHFSKKHRNYFIIDTILTAFIETMLQGLRADLLSLHNAFMLINGCMTNGVIDTLREKFNIEVDDTWLMMKK